MEAMLLFKQSNVFPTKSSNEYVRRVRLQESRPVPSVEISGKTKWVFLLNLIIGKVETRTDINRIIWDSRDTITLNIIEGLESF